MAHTIEMVGCSKIFTPAANEETQKTISKREELSGFCFSLDSNSGSFLQNPFHPSKGDPRLQEPVNRYNRSDPTPESHWLPKTPPVARRRDDGCGVRSPPRTAGAFGLCSFNLRGHWMRFR